MSIINNLHVLDQIVDSLVDVGKHTTEILGIVALGSLARSDLKANSDLDLAVVIQEKSLEQVKDLVIEHLEKNVNLSVTLILDFNSRIVLYFKHLPHLKVSDAGEWVFTIKLDIFFVDDPKDLLKYLEESETDLDYWDDITLLDKNGAIRRSLSVRSKTVREKEKTADHIRFHVYRFVECFEEASRAHFGGDSYRYVSRMMDAFHHLVVLHHVARGELMSGSKHVKYALESLPMVENFEFRSLIPDANLEIANVLKIKHYEQFSSILDNFVTRHLFSEVDAGKLKKFCEFVIKRDLFWNFRDVALIKPTMLRKGVLYRSAYLYHPELKEEFLELLRSHDIRTIIDLRTNKENDNSDYESFLKIIGVKYVNIPLDPQKYRPREVELRYIGYENENQYRPALYEILPRYLTKELREVFKALVSHDSPILMHCHAGKDRTGMIMSILLSALGLNEDEVILDYRLATPDIETTLIRITLAVINECGGAGEYLKKKVRLSSNDLEKMRQMLLKKL